MRPRFQCRKSIDNAKIYVSSAARHLWMLKAALGRNEERSNEKVA